ncbi:glycine betaine ABC transporter substrate-binding protein [Jiangella sp. DSM 45060]|uniref:glycine betaine ABC transporter substrate-binding protein n=1 Tax=Jiangella sp. DSM 45060 TaxID=1798224 RepID=UPI00087B372B|nr:glycine betaine ABC transporter substrate-binding protein [Jiangella sp. DSM 45060]SDT02750.1 glycine betaine/proline transport system substrate-binding protein [Jiangella sp. DSM 45060]
MAATASVLGLGLTLAACGDDGGSGDDTITIGVISSWTDYLSMGYLWKDIFEDEGYTVEIQELADNGPLYTGLADGDIDLMPSSWPEVTHAQYMDEFGDDIEDLATYYDGAVLTFAVPEYTDIDSIDQLVGNAERFGGRIVGIESGAGLTEITQNAVMPQYGLDAEYELITSSTVAMLAELSNAIEAQEDIVVTLWRPFWANNAFPVKDLEDPQGALGEPESLHVLSSKDFKEEHADLAEMIGNARLDDEQYGSLENLVVNEYGEGQEAEAVAEWLELNPDWVETLQG